MHKHYKLGRMEFNWGGELYAYKWKNDNGSRTLKRNKVNVKSETTGITWLSKGAMQCIDRISVSCCFGFFFTEGKYF